MRALVTGAAGFAGQWLAQALLAGGHEIWGLSLDAPASSAVLTSAELRAIHWRKGDVRDRGTIAGALDASRPEMIFHLAGVSFVPQAEADPGPACEVNIVACARLLGELRGRRAAGTLDPSVIVVGSGEQYGAHEAAAPLAESAEQRPLTVYAATKAAQEVLALQAFRRDAIRVIVTRSFNHVGTGQDPRFLLPSLVARTIALRYAGASELVVGNTTPVRDFTHVSDVARAYILLAARGVPGTAYNVCSGEGRSVASVARLVGDRAGVSVQLREDPELVRPVDVPTLIGDPTRLELELGWRRQRSFEQSIDEMIHAATH